MTASIAVTLFAACTTIKTPKNMALFNGSNLDNWVVENDGQFFNGFRNALNFFITFFNGNIKS